MTNNPKVEHFRWYTCTNDKYPNWHLNLVGADKVFYVEIMNSDYSLHQIYIGKNFADAELNFEYLKNKMKNNQDINLNNFADFLKNKPNFDK